MTAKEQSKKRKAAAVTSAPSKKPRKTTKAEIKAASAPVIEEPPAPAPISSNDDELVFDDDAASEPEDDQTAALLKGFESSSEDEAPPSAKSLTTIPALPTSTALHTQLADAAAAASEDAASQQPGVVYVGRVPHGFYEHQMRAYFSQFGHITRLRLSRNRRTGASKHYAFVEFASGEVARIVAEAMDNYLMFGHILKVKLVPREQVHEELFKGAGSRFKKVPWNRIDRFRVQGTDREGWERRVRGEEERRAEKAAKLRELGYEFDAPKLREVADVPVKAVEDAPAKAVEGPSAMAMEDETKAAETEASVVAPQVEKMPGADAAVVQAVAGSDGASEVPSPKEPRKLKKTKRVSSDGIVEKVAKKPKVAKDVVKARKASRRQDA